MNNISRGLGKTGIALLVINIMTKTTAFILMALFARLFAVDILVDAYYAGEIVTGVINNSLMVCVIQLFIPVYAKCKSLSGDAEANRFASNVLNVSIVFNVLLFIIIFIASPILARVVAPGFTKEGVINTQRMICLLSTSFPFTIGTCILGFLSNCEGHYYTPALMTLFNHIYVIFFLVVVGSRYGIYSYPIICTSAWVIQGGYLYSFMRKRGFYHSKIFDLKDKEFVYMVRKSVPMMIATAGEKMELGVDSVIGSDLNKGSVSRLGYSQRIYESVENVVTGSILTIFYPVLSKLYSEGKEGEFYANLRKCFEAIMLITIISSAFFAVVSEDLVEALFGFGGDNYGDTRSISRLLMLYMAGLFFLSMKSLFTRLYYIKGETKAAAAINILWIILNIGISLLLKKTMGIYGLAIATTISTGLCSCIAFIILLIKTGGIRKLVKRGVVRLKGVGHPFFTATISYFTAKMLCSLAASGQVVIRILISTVGYTITAILILVFVKNEYVLQLLREIRQYVARKE